MKQEVTPIQLPVYSTAEQKTGRKWVDGKDTYTKQYVLPLQARPVGNNVIDSSLKSTLIDTVVNMHGCIAQQGGGQFFWQEATRYASLSEFALVIRPNEGLVLASGNSTSGSVQIKGTVTVEYTKA